MKYTYNVGLYKGDTVTVETDDGEKTAYRLACAEMDRRYDEQDREPPVAWTLVLIEVE